MGKGALVSDNLSFFMAESGGVRISSEKGAKPRKGEVKMNGVTEVVIFVEPANLVRASINLRIVGDLTLERIDPNLMTFHPTDGDLRPIKSIEFTDGSKWEKRDTLKMG